MTKPLIILTGEPLTPYYCKKFSFLRKKKKLIKITVWNIMPIISNKINKKYFPKEQHPVKKHKDFHNIENLSQLFFHLNKLPKKFYFFNSAPKLIKSLVLEKILNYKGGQKISIQLGGIPQISSSFFETLKFRLINFHLVFFIKFILIPIKF